MQVKFLEQIKHQGNNYEADDVTTVDDQTGAYFCSNGWAEDLSGSVPTAERDVNRRVTLDVDSAKQNTRAEIK